MLLHITTLIQRLKVADAGNFYITTDQIGKLVAEAAVTDSTVDDLSKEINTQGNEITELEGIIEDLRIMVDNQPRVAELEEQLSNKTAMYNIVEGLKAESSSKHIDAIKEIEALKSTITELKASVQFHEEEYRSLELAYFHQQDEEAGLKRKVKGLKLNISDLKVTIGELNREVNGLQSELRDANEEIEELKTNNDSFQLADTEQLQKYDELLQAHNLLMKKAESLESDNKELKGRLQGAIDACSALRKANLEKTEQITSLTIDISEGSKARQELVDELSRSLEERLK